MADRDLILAAFPDYDGLDSLPEIPAIFACEAWINDIAPVWRCSLPVLTEGNDAPVIELWADYANPSLREMGYAHRFSVMAYYGAPGADARSQGRPRYDGDDGAEAVRAALSACVMALAYENVGYHPDTPGDDYLPWPGSHDADLLNALHEACAKAGIDPYAIGAEAVERANKDREEREQIDIDAPLAPLAPVADPLAALLEHIPIAQLRRKPLLVQHMHLVGRAASVEVAPGHVARFVAPTSLAVLRQGADTVEAMLAALKLAEEKVAEAIECHIYDHDDTIPEDCSFTAALATIRAAIADAENQA